MTSSLTQPRRAGFTLAETVIAIGILAALITVFFAVFALATQGVRRAISVQDADRLAFALEQELTTLRGSDGVSTGFDKAFNWIESGNQGADVVVVVYQYRGDARAATRADGTLTPFTGSGGVAGQDFVVQTVARRNNDPFLTADLDALVGRVFGVAMTQLVFEDGELVRGTPGEIHDPKNGGRVQQPDAYPEAVIAFTAEFFALQTSAADFIRDQLDLSTLDRPIFTRNIAVRR